MTVETCSISRFKGHFYGLDDCEFVNNANAAIPKIVVQI